MGFLSVTLMLALFSLAANAQTAINVNGAASGPAFYGIGAMSAGGGNSRLLYDYPAAQQSQILDYLFKPGVGATLQVLKVEIGGGADSTDGSESSIEPVQGTVNCSTGYEWWLMEQAQARNPNIKFYALTWTSPGWIGGWWNTNAINYLVSYLTCAKQNGVPISYLGGFNETQGDGTAAWWEQLRSTLNADGFSSVQLIGGDLIDGFTGIANGLNGNSNWAAVMDIIGAHYPCGNWPPTTGGATTCVPNGHTAAVQTGKPMWQSEGGALDYEQGAGYVIRSIVRGYVDGGMVEYNNWPIIAALYPNLVYPTQGLIWADQPWSGWYSVGATTAVLGQVAQFTQPGWTFTNGGYLQGTESDGTYMTLKSTNGTDYSTIIETTTASASQTVTFNVSGGLSTGTMYVWATNLGSSSQSNWMVQQSSITPVNGSFSLTLQPNYVYSITTTTGQGFGTTTSPTSSVMSLPYSDTFAGYPTGSTATYVSQIQGDFQSQPCATQSGNCLTQMFTQAPSIWFYGDVGTPWAVMGDTNWTNYTVSVNALMEQAGRVYLAGRVGAGMGSFSGQTDGGTAPAAAWQEGVSSATVLAGTLVDMGPQPLTGGSWSWTSSNGFTSTAREIDNINITTSAIYLAVYTDSTGCQSSQYFTFTVTGTTAATAPTVPTPPCNSPTAITPYLLINTGPYPDGFNGYSLQVSNTGAWAMLSNSATTAPSQLATGTLATPPGLNTWVTLSMTFNGSTISGSINGANVANVTNSTYSGGQVGFGMANRSVLESHHYGALHPDCNRSRAFSRRRDLAKYRHRHRPTQYGGRPRPKSCQRRIVELDWPKWVHFRLARDRQYPSEFRRQHIRGYLHQCLWWSDDADLCHYRQQRQNIPDDQLSSALNSGNLRCRFDLTGGGVQLWTAGKLLPNRPGLHQRDYPQLYRRRSGSSDGFSRGQFKLLGSVLYHAEHRRQSRYPDGRSQWFAFALLRSAQPGVHLYHRPLRQRRHSGEGGEWSAHVDNDGGTQVSSGQLRHHGRPGDPRFRKLASRPGGWSRCSAGNIWSQLHLQPCERAIDDHWRRGPDHHVSALGELHPRYKRATGRGLELRPSSELRGRQRAGVHQRHHVDHHRHRPGECYGVAGRQQQLQRGHTGHTQLHSAVRGTERCKSQYLE